MFPLAMRAALMAGSSAWTPTRLFASGEVGAWYDPSDLTTMFQDSAGTTPVTAVEQPVGLVLDKSRGGTPSARLNRAIYSEAFSTTWGSSNLTLLSGQGDPNGGTSAFRLEANSSIGFAQLFLVTTTANVLKASGQQTVSLYAKAGTASFITISTFNGGVRSENYFNVSAGTVGTINQSGGSGAISSVGNGWYRCSVTYTPASTPDYYAFAICDANNSSGITAGRQAFVFGFDVRSGALGTYQKITTGLNGEWVPGNHLSQSTSTARPVLSARVNLLTYTEDFSNAIWVKSNCTASAMNVADPVGGNTASTITATAASGFFYHNASSATTTVSNSVWVRRRTGTGAIRFRTAAGGTDTDYSSSITSSWSLLTWQCTPSGNANTFVISLATSGDAIDIWHPDCRPANAGVGLPAYQRVGAATDYDASGFPYYLKGDGVDDHLLGPNIGNLITVSDYEACVGARFNVVTTNTSPWLNQSLVTDNAGYVGIGAAKSTGFIGALNFDTNGDEATVAMVAPATIVLQQRHTGGNVIISTNGGSEASATSGDTGSVSNPTQVLKAFGAVYTNGHIYGIVIRQTPFTAGERLSIRDWMNSKTKAF